ncbi:aminotransferase class I/II-fold pyridoxal phosphate-dependent enzyme [Gynuella sunshinyii]|uniref:Aspartate/tyrosine/aromatic aminotransferase n=1 Tax=Gynuella sunshinyii YC6258 TaxID=1445510 RepID=A0A0C5VJV3_9GAMM|nr:aminotransferase class I/II-fold pyridoxal phosphate-dependent enzyme [Gynuella sunshinyii]AJQ93658.1 aspartate/tyrosine/aromatic aminotransferase [Gynuella sunshinyii YC6258]
MQVHLAARLAKIAPFHVMALLARARELQDQGRDIVHLEVGEPDFPTPQAIIDAAQSAVATGETRYTAALGIPRLRQKIADFYQQKYQLQIPASRIAVTPGASGALQLAFAATLNSGDELILIEPGYPCNRHFAELFGIQPVIVNTDRHNGYLPTLEELETARTSRTRGLLLASPGNPTGTVIPRALLLEIIAFCQRHDIQLFMDEIYQGLVFDCEQTDTVLQYDQRAWVIQSFSKYFQMTGWRLGWLVMPEGYEDAVNRIAQNIFLCPPSMSQYGAVRAFEPDVIELLEQRRSELRQRRDILKQGLERLGFVIDAAPDGAFYLYCDASAFTRDAMTFCWQLLEQAGIAATPGQDFGGAHPDTSIRFAYTQPIAVLQEALVRLESFIGAV